MFSSVQDVQAGLCGTGYITDEITATIVYLAARLHKPILLEGPPGSGKTELAYAVAKAISTEVERLQCFEGINEEKAIGKFDESLQRLAVELRARAGPMGWEPLKQELHSLNFFSAGPLLRALQYPKPCVLLIDELDKVSQAFETIQMHLNEYLQKKEEEEVETARAELVRCEDPAMLAQQIHDAWVGGDGIHPNLLQLLYDKTDGDASPGAHDISGHRLHDDRAQRENASILHRSRGQNARTSRRAPGVALRPNRVAGNRPSGGQPCQGRQPDPPEMRERFRRQL